MEQSVEKIKEFLEANNISDINEKEDIFIHGVRRDPVRSEETINMTTEQLAESFFNVGVKNSPTASITSTIKLLEKNENTISDQIKDYSFHGAIYKIILKIPQELDDIYLGHCKSLQESDSHRAAKNHLLDYLHLGNIPREFIVGIIYTDDNNKTQYVENPYYYDHKENKEENTKALVEQLKAAINKYLGPAKNLFLGKTINEQIDFYVKYFKEDLGNSHIDNLVFFQNQLLACHPELKTDEERNFENEMKSLFEI